MTNMKLTDVLVLLLNEMQRTKVLEKKYKAEGMQACAEAFTAQADTFQQAADAVMQAIKGGAK